MPNPVIPIDLHDAKESGRAIQIAQDTFVEAGAAATIALIRELLKRLKLQEKSANVEISINQNFAVVNVASDLLDRFGSKTANGKQVFEVNAFRLERWNNNLTVTAKDGRGTLLSLKDGELIGSLTTEDVERFQAVERQLNRSSSKQSQAEIQ
ncbi:MAG: hypothetical protein AB4426_14530 [Xenococcaceae cyanobacterium]